LVLLAAAYSIVLLSCRWLAYQLRFDFAIPPSARQLVLQNLQNWLWVLGAQLLFLAGFRQFSGVTRYFGLLDTKNLLWAVACSTFFLCLLRSLQSDFYSPPRGVILIEAALGFGGLCGLRLAYRLLHERHWSAYGNSPGQLQHVAILGAGDVGASLVLELNHRPGLGLKPVVFLDDDAKKWNS
jgi:FlaA1/EpsC-like NDP-sugar epimerase